MHLQEPLEGSLSRPGLPLILFIKTIGNVPYSLFSKLVGVAYHTGNFPAHCQTSAMLFSLHQTQLPVRKKVTRFGKHLKNLFRIFDRWSFLWMFRHAKPHVFMVGSIFKHYFHNSGDPDRKSSFGALFNLGEKKMFCKNELWKKGLEGNVRNLG